MGRSRLRCGMRSIHKMYTAQGMAGCYPLGKGEECGLGLFVTFHFIRTSSGHSDGRIYNVSFSVQKYLKIYLIRYYIHLTYLLF